MILITIGLILLTVSAETFFIRRCTFDYIQAEHALEAVHKYGSCNVMDYYLRYVNELSTVIEEIESSDVTDDQCTYENAKRQDPHDIKDLLDMCIMRDFALNDSLETMRDKVKSAAQHMVDTFKGDCNLEELENVSYFHSLDDPEFENCLAIETLKGLANSDLDVTEEFKLRHKRRRLERTVPIFSERVNRKRRAIKRRHKLQKNKRYPH
ncbi:hypothetical protein C0J52_09354 [Blattella germanica]|nr:hypothetical protein C0J52_09354 [Blattella germanica]